VIGSVSSDTYVRAASTTADSMAAAFGSFVMESSNETCITKPPPASAPTSTSVPAAAPTAGVAALASGRAAPASPGASSATRLSCSTRPTGKPPTTSSAPAAGCPAPAPTNTIASATAESRAIGRSVRRDATNDCLVTVLVMADIGVCGPPPPVRSRAR